MEIVGAIRQGKLVSTEVLKDYPDLKKQAEDKAKSTFTEKWAKSYGDRPETVKVTTAKLEGEVGKGIVVVRDVPDPYHIVRVTQKGEHYPIMVKGINCKTGKLDTLITHSDRTFVDDWVKSQGYKVEPIEVTDSEQAERRVMDDSEAISKAVKQKEPSEVEQYLIERAAEGSLSPYSTIHFTDEQNKALKRLVKKGIILKAEEAYYSGPGNRYRYILPVEETKKRMRANQVIELQAIEDARSPRSKSADESRSNLVSSYKPVSMGDNPKFTGTRGEIDAMGNPTQFKKRYIDNLVAHLENIRWRLDNDIYGDAPIPSLLAEAERITNDLKVAKSMTTKQWSAYIAVFRKSQMDKIPMVSEAEVDRTAELQAIHDARSTRSKSADESRSNADTIDPEDPRVGRWMRDPGSMDVKGIDTPKGKYKVGRRPIKRAGKGDIDTQIGETRR